MTFEATVQIICDEIDTDIKRGIVPKTVASFSELHDYVDANEYGGFCEGDGVETEFANRCQNAVDALIKKGEFK